MGLQKEIAMGSTSEMGIEQCGANAWQHFQLLVSLFFGSSCSSSFHRHKSEKTKKKLPATINFPTVFPVVFFLLLCVKWPTLFLGSSYIFCCFFFRRSFYTSICMSMQWAGIWQGLKHNDNNRNSNNKLNKKIKIKYHDRNCNKNQPALHSPSCFELIPFITTWPGVKLNLLARYFLNLVGDKKLYHSLG